jgi:hypothetical protein
MRHLQSYQLTPFLPTAFVIGWVVLAAISIATGSGAVIGLPVALYVGIIMLSAIIQGAWHRANPLLISIVYPLIHFGYGLGLLGALLGREEKKETGERT